MSSVRAPGRLAFTTAASLAAAFHFSPVAAGSPPARPEITVTIFSDYYAVDGRAIDDLDVLEKAIGSVGARTVTLQGCGWTAERAQRAAAHRFRSLNLELRFLEPHAAACQVRPALREVTARTPRGVPPYGIDDEVVDRWWHAAMP